MTLASAWPFIGASLAVALLVLLAARLGFAGRPELAGEAELRDIADTVDGGFEAVAAIIDGSRHAGLLRDEAGRVVLVTNHGAHFVARMLGPRSHATLRGPHLLVASEGPAVALALGDQAAEWLAAIERRT